MKILITGAAGFMGSHLFDYLYKQGHEVHGIDNYSIGSYEHACISRVDLLNKDAVAAVVKQYQPEVIYHLAAWAHEGLSSFCPQRITENTYNAYLNVLIPAIKYKVGRMVFTSSMSVYGDQVPPFDEHMARMPVDIYGLAKTSCEEATEMLSQVHKFEWNIVRPHNVYGPRQNLSDPYRNVVAIFMNNCMRGKPMFIYGSGNQTRAFSYIDDVTPALAQAGLIGEFKFHINIGPTYEYSINSLAEEVAKHFPNAPIVYVPERPLEVKDAYCTNNLAKRILKYETKTSFSEGIAKMAAWAKEHGPVQPRYLEELELPDNAPETWTKKLI